MNTANTDVERWSLFRANVAMFLDHPLLGVGYGDNVRHVKEYYDRFGLPESYLISHAHNQYLNVLATTGIAGFLFFCGFYFFYPIWNIKYFFEYRKNGGEYLALFFALLWMQLEYVLANFTDVGFEYAKIRAIILMCWALLTVTVMKSKSAGPDAKL
ncbi:MAG: O-antigen ligase family protein [Pseudobdellovibrio sp.]